MHSNIGLKDGLLFRGNTNLCLGGGWTKSIKVLNNCLFINNKVKTVKTDCFGNTFIGPGEAIIFQDHIYLQNKSITSSQFKYIVFKKDASLDDQAFFLEKLHNDYILYCYKGSSVEKFAIEHHFVFKTLEEFNYKKKVHRYHYTDYYKKHKQTI